MGCDIYLAFKAICYKLNDKLQALLISTHCWKDLSMNFVTDLSISADWKDNSYDLILIIVDCLTKIVYHEPVKVTIDKIGLAEVIINMIK